MSTALATVDVTKYQILKRDPDDIREIFAANMGTAPLSELDLDRVVMPTGGSLFWTVPGLSGDKPAEYIEGVIVAQGDRRVYWEQSIDEGGAGKPPDCISRDGIIGEGKIADTVPGRLCAQCPKSKYGSAKPKPGKTDARGQACNQKKLLFLLREGDVVPLVIALAPTSISSMQQYALRLASQGIVIYKCVTRLKLAEDKNDDGVKYAYVVPEFVGLLPDADGAKIKSIAGMFREMFNQQSVLQRHVLMTTPASRPPEAAPVSSAAHDVVAEQAGGYTAPEKSGPPGDASGKLDQAQVVPAPGANPLKEESPKSKGKR